MAHTPSPAIVSMNLFITQTCNMNGGGGEYGAPGQMQTDTARQAVDWLWGQRGKTRKLFISFFGGEPLLQFELLRQVVSYATELGAQNATTFHFGLSTNATLLTDTVIQYLKKHQFHVNVGFDGPPKIHDRNRPMRNGNGSYDVVAPCIRRLIAAMPQAVTLRATLWRKGEIMPVRQALSNLQPARYQTHPASPGGHRGQNDQMMPTADETDAAQALQATAEMFLDALHKENIELLYALKQWLNFNWILKCLDPPPHRPPMCNMGRTMAAVSATGYIYPCHRFVGWPEARIGNVHNGRLDRDRYCRAAYPYTPECPDCESRAMCSGGCLFSHKIKTGDCWTPSPDYCRMMRAMFRTVQYLKYRLTERQRQWLLQERILEPRFCPLDLF